MKTILILFSVISMNILSQTPGWHTLPNAPIAETNVGRFDDIYFINAMTGWIIEGNYGGAAGWVYKTTNGGNNWTLSNHTIGAYLRSTGFFDSNTGIIGIIGDSIHILYRTNDGGFTWTDITQNIQGTIPRGICGISIVNSGTAFASGRFSSPANVIKTTNAGLNWTSMPIDTSLVRSLVDCHFWTSDSGFIVGGYSPVNNYNTGHSVVLNTTNGGLSWSRAYYSSRADEWCWKINFVNRQLGFVSIERTTGFAYYLKTTNGGINWIDEPFMVYDEEGIGFVNENTGWIGGDFSRPNYETTNAGVSWHAAGWGNHINRIRFLSDTLAYASGLTIYKYTSEPIGIVPISTEAPKQFSLEQNYPNPFNPETIIRFGIPPVENGRNRSVRLIIYNAIGQQITTFVNEQLKWGIYEVKWNASNFASGVYFYRLEAVDPGSSSGQVFVESKKMVLVK